MQNVFDDRYSHFADAPCIMRPRTSVLYDTEVFPAGGVASSLLFFVAPANWIMQHNKEKKTEVDTNLLNSMHMKDPDEFSVLDIGLRLDGDVSVEDQKSFFKSGVLTFTYCKKVFKHVLLNNFSEFENITAEVRERALKLQVDKAAIRIRSHNEFFVEIKWKNPPKLSADVRVMAYFNGFLWAPM